MSMNRLSNSKNSYQGKTKKVLCVCSAGLLRSPTTAHILSQPPYNFNTRAAGISKEYALIPVDHVLLEWADEIVCMQYEHAEVIKHMSKEYNVNGKNLLILDIPDRFAYMDPELVRLVKESYDAISLQDHRVTEK